MIIWMQKYILFPKYIALYLYISSNLVFINIKVLQVVFFGCLASINNFMFVCSNHYSAN
jgi:hypothetical protein